MGAFGQSIASVTKEELGVQMLKLMVIQQLAIVACPPLIMALILTTSFRSTLKLNWPHWKFLVVAVVLPLAMHPLCLELLASLQWFFPPLPEGATRMLKNMGDPSIPLWLILIAFAAAPAICEELAFRGFLLTGFSRGRRAWLAIVLSAVTFGLMHMIPQQVFNAALLGLVLHRSGMARDSRQQPIARRGVSFLVQFDLGAAGTSRRETVGVRRGFTGSNRLALVRATRSVWPSIQLADADRVWHDHRLLPVVDVAIGAREADSGRLPGVARHRRFAASLQPASDVCLIG